MVEDSRGRLIVSDLCNGMFVPEKMAPGQLDERRRTPGTNCKGDRIQIVDKDGKHVAFWPDAPSGAPGNRGRAAIRQRRQTHRDFGRSHR